MHIAVAKGAPEKKTFTEYVDYLVNHHLVPSDAKHWIDHIRTKGNEANHEIVIMSAEDAQDLVTFCEMLLKVLYEYPARITERTTPPLRSSGGGARGSL